MINWVRVITLAMMVLVPGASRAEGTGGGAEAPLNLLNPRITVFGNATVRVDDRPVYSGGGVARLTPLTSSNSLLPESIEIPVRGKRTDDTFNLRETELDFRAAVDPFADGVVIVTAESEAPGEFETGIEEGYIVLKALPWLERMPLGLNLKLGRFRAAMGQLNIIHTHDLPQTTRPVVIRDFLGDEGFIADGVSASVSIPVSAEWLAFDGIAQVVNGGGIAAAPGGLGSPGYVGRFQTFANPWPSHSLTAGLSAHTGKQRPGRHRTTAGVDATYKWKPLKGGEWMSLLVGGEAFAMSGVVVREMRMPTVPAAVSRANGTLPEGEGQREEEPHEGYFGFVQTQLGRPLYCGIRWDRAEALEDGKVEKQFTPYVTYYFSEFLRFRTSWERTWPRDDTFWVELNFVIGSHPPEPYWVNK